MWNVLIVGLGKISLGYDYHLDSGKYILTHANAFDQHPSYKLVGGVDVTTAQRELFTKKYNAPAFHDLKQALTETSPDIIVIAVPTQQHLTTVEFVLQNSKPLMIFCEKPLAYDLAEAKKITDLCDLNGCKLYVNYIRRSHPGVIEIKNRIKQGSIELPVKGFAWYSKGLIHNGSHFIDLLQYWLDSMTDFQVIEKNDNWDSNDPEPDFLIKFKYGTIYFLAAQEDYFSHYTIELVAPNGRLRYENGGENIYWQGVITDPVIEGYKRLNPHVEVIESGMDHSQWHVVNELSKSLNNENADICKGDEALQTLESLSMIRSQA